MSKLNLRAALEASASSAGDADAHPSVDELVLYHGGELDQGERDRVTWHLAACDECAQAVLDIARFPKVEALEPTHRLSQQDVSERWLGLRDRLRAHAEAPSSSAEVVGLKSGGGSWVGAAWFARVAAAFLLATTLGLSWTVVLLRSEDSSPRLNLPIVELAARDEPAERSEPLEQAVRVPAGAEAVLLVMTLVDPRPYAGYEAEIRDADRGGEVIWSSAALQRSPEGVFTIEISRDFLPAGRYEIAIRVEGESELLAGYGLQIEYE